MELRQLRYAEAVARHRHFTRAAEELHVAQSALSAQIGKLEAELGVELFERNSRSVKPTEAGRAVAARARRVLTELEGARGEIEALRGLLRGRIAIGALLPAGEVDVPDLLARFSKAHPGIEVGLREGTAGDMLDLLVANEIDVAFSLLAGDLPGGVEAEQLSEEELVAVFPPGNAPAGSHVVAADLGRQRLITPRRGSATRRALDDLFAEAGQLLHVSLESGDVFLLRCLVSGGFGAAVLPRSLIELPGPPLEVRGLSPSIRLPVVLLWRARRHHSPAARAFLDFVRVGSGA